MAEDLVRRDPDAAVKLLGEARASAVSALNDLRTVMQGIQPAVLADRGLVGGIRALALDLVLPVTVTGDVPAGLPDAVESAAYFATAECLANAVKHSRADRGWVGFGYRDDVLTVVVGDDGIGGASLTRGTGLRGVAHRLEAFDGLLHVDSPDGGPTVVTITVAAPLERPPE
jgi:signal transduction histidine kinase